MLTLCSLFRLLPETVKLHYLKVDTEGNDLNVLLGATTHHLRMFRGVSIECQPEDKAMRQHGGCTVPKAVDFMRLANFNEHQFVDDGGNETGNLHFGHEMQDVQWARRMQHNLAN